MAKTKISEFTQDPNNANGFNAIMLGFLLNHANGGRGKTRMVLKNIYKQSMTTCKRTGKSEGNKMSRCFRSGLTRKQLTFCSEYLKDFNASQAYIRAGYTTNVHAATASASRLLRHPSVVAYLDKYTSGHSDHISRVEYKTKLLQKGAKVYFFLDENSRAVKIGYAYTPLERLRHCQTGNANLLIVLALIDGGRKREQEIHKDLDAYRIRGEWFQDNKIVRDYIAKVVFQQKSVDASKPNPLAEGQLSIL